MISPLPFLSQPTSPIVWHYTVGAAIQRILADGELKLSWLGRRYPVLWFSTNPVWEPSAGKKDDQGRGILGKEETALRYGGLYRIGVSPPGLTPWNEWKLTLRPNPQSLIQFERYGNPSEWWCSFGVVKRDRWKNVERLTDDKWQALFQHDVIPLAIVKTPDVVPPTAEEIAAFWKYWESRT